MFYPFYVNINVLNYKISNYETMNLSFLQAVDFNGSSRYEKMISDPNFTAKTHYFAKRLEELRQLHEFYRNLAKQAPRGRNSIHSPEESISEISEEDESVVSENQEKEPAVLPQPIFSQEGALSSLKIGAGYDFDWKSLLPEEIELNSEAGDVKIEEDTASEVSKDINDPIYDIQSDIMPYLPSNYVSLTMLSTNTQTIENSDQALNHVEEKKTKELIKSEDKEKVIESKENIIENENIVTEKFLPDKPLLNGASLSDDENNVKQVKVKKEKRKKKITILPKSNKSNVKDDPDIEEVQTPSKLSWSRFFGSPKHKSQNKDKSNKSKSGSKTSLKSIEKNERKAQKEKERGKDHKSNNVKDMKISSRDSRTPPSQENHYSNESLKISEKISKSHQKSDGEKQSPSTKSTKSPSRKSSENRSGNNSSSKSSRRSDLGSRETVNRQHQESNSNGGARYQGGFHWDSPLPPFLPVSTTAVHPGYDSGADSGVGLKVTIYILS